ncbi:hypothetical protein [Flavobacterium selenitireducens]|nr:hypothetical protein [Flavobacterium selenitireducens]
MKNLNIPNALKRQSDNCNKVIAENIGKFYVKAYDCMLVLRLFI